MDDPKHSRSSSRCHRSRASSCSSKSGGSKEPYEQDCLKNTPRSSSTLRCNLSRSSSSSSKGSFKEPYEADYCYLGGFKKLPSSTSKWTTICLDSLGIYYDNDFLDTPGEILDIICDKRGIFGPLTTNQHKYASTLIKNISFSSSVEEILAVEHEDVDIYPSDKLLPEMKEDVKNLHMGISAASSEQIHTVAEDFIFYVRNMVLYQVEYMKNHHRYPQFPVPLPHVPKDMFVDIVKVFARMCRLFVAPGSAWKGGMHIQETDVTSTADLVFMPIDFDHEPLENPSPNLSIIVSVVEMKNLHRRKETSLLEPAIYQTIKSSTLAQHGGELLLHYGLYAGKLIDLKKKWQYLPGMLVIGTKVIFTLLEINKTHLLELGQMEKDDTVTQKAKIYYSQPKDFLRKEDRDILIEAFSRLNNV